MLRLFAILLALTSFTTTGQAHDGRAYELERDDEVRRCVGDHRPRFFEKRRNHHENRPDPRVVQCGEIITTHTVMANDLVCPDTTGFALLVIGDNVTLDGNGHSITAPNAAAALFAEGDDITITRLKANGTTQGAGLLAYETPRIQIQGNDFSRNLIGISVYADRSAVAGMTVKKNRASNNQLFGIRTSFDAPGSIVSPVIQWNDFSRSGSYAMQIKAASWKLTSLDGNALNNSTNGVYLAHGAFLIEGFTTAFADIRKIGVFVDSADQLEVKTSDFSTRTPGDSNQERIGLDLYRVKMFKIRTMRAHGNDTALKLETEGGVSPEGSVKDCDFSYQAVAGVVIESYDGTPYGRLFMSCIRFCHVAVKYLVSGGTTLGTGTQLL